MDPTPYKHIPVEFLLLGQKAILSPENFTNITAVCGLHYLANLTWPAFKYFYMLGNLSRLLFKILEKKSKVKRVFHV